MKEKLSSIKLPRIRVSIVFVGVILAILGLSFFYWATQVKGKELDKSIKTYDSKIENALDQESNYMRLYEDMDFYLEETDKLQLETDEILDQFPTYMYLEDKILYIDQLLKTDLKNFNFKDISYSQSEFITSVSYEGDSIVTQDPENGSEEDQNTNDGSEEEQNTNDGSEEDQNTNAEPIENEHKGNMLDLYRVTFSMTYENASYKEIKELLDYGLKTSEREMMQRFVVNNITMAFSEETGLLNGNVSFYTYFIFGQKDPYKFPESVLNDLGSSTRTDDLFGTIE